MIAFYYALTGFACAIFYRRELTKSVKNFLFIGVGPLVDAGQAHLDVAIATEWTTAFPVRDLPRCREKAYLVQDHEPEFFATSSESPPRKWNVVPLTVVTYG